METTTIMVPEGNGGRRLMNERAAKFEALLRLSGRPYSVIETKAVKQIEWEGGRRKYVLKSLTGKELNFIKKVKRHVGGLELPARLRPFTASVAYNLNAANLEPGQYDGYCEIDVSGAYWKTAFDLGYISREIFTEGNDKTQVRKKVRLMALGSLAKKTERLEYSPPYDARNIRVDVDVCPLEIFWDNISYSFGLVMNECFSVFRDQILGYWVDAVFVRQDAAALVRKFFAGQGYDVKLIPLENLEVLEDEKDDRKLFIRRTIKGEVKDLPPFDRLTGRAGQNTFKAARERFLGYFEKYQ